MTERSIFMEAIEIEDPAARAAYLEQACAGKADLRGRVEQLLKAHTQSGPFMDRPAPAQVGTVDVPIREGPGTVIGPYKLLEQIGEGGFGVVFMAEQQHPVRRKVALKVLKPGMDTRQVVARFEAERQALALMEHPNIAHVFDGGQSASGRPFFVMELVRGISITDFCDQNQLPIRDRLELFVTVCQAVQHAHQKGIIHRDLKPSNVLIASHDGTPVPKVIDFGIAKAMSGHLTDQTLFTGFAQMLGTPLYMSPEQAGQSSLDVDTRSDIYSLGVMLYELLTGTTPFAKERFKEAGYDEVCRIIREEEPPKPSTRLSELSDVGRFSKPSHNGSSLASISAQRHMEPAKLTKLVRGELDWIVMKALEKDRNRRYETANGFAMDVQRYLADEPVLACPPSAAYRFRKFARRNQGGLAVAGLVLAFVVILGAGAGWALRDRAAREQEVAQESARKLALTEEGIRQTVERAGNSLGELHAALKKNGGAQELLNQPARWELFLKTAQAELTQAQRLLAGAEGNLDAEVTQALARLEQRLAGDEADYRLALRLEKIRLDRATWVKDRFDLRTAAEEYPKAFAGFEILARSPETAAARLSASPIKEQLVAALDDWAYVAHKSKDKRLLERLLAVAREAGPDPAWGDRLRRAEVWDDQMELARLAAEAPAAAMSPQLLNLVGSLMITGRPHQVEWRRRAQAQHPADFWLALELGNAVSDPAEAALWLRVALAIRPTNATAYSNLGIALRDQKKLPEAIAAYQKALELDPEHGFAHNGLGLVFADQRKFDEAIACYRKAIKFAPHWTYVNLGDSLTSLRKLDEAVAAYSEAIKLDKRDAVAYAALGQALRFQKKLDDAVAACRKAIDIDPKYAVAYDGLGCALCQQRKFEEAIANFWEAIKLDRKDHLTWANLDDAYHAAQKLDDAIAAYREAITREPDHAIPYYFLGNALRAKKKLSEAIAAYQMAIKLNPKYVVAYGGLGDALSAAQKLDDAIAAYEKAIELNPKYVPARSNLGAVLLEQGNHEAAAAAYQQAIKLDPNNATLYYNLGNALDKLQQLNEAVAAFQKAIQLDERHALAYSALSQVLRFQGKFDESVAASHKAIELRPNYPGVYSDLGITFKLQRKLDEAVTVLQRAIAIDPNYVPAYTILGNVLRAQKKLPEAIAAHRKAIELNPKYAIAYNNLGNVLRAQKKLPEAIAAFRKAIELDPKYVAAYHNLGLVSKDSKDVPGAIAAYKKAIALDPQDATAHNALAWLLATCADAKFRDPSLAVVHAKKAVELAPQSRLYRNTLGAAYYRAGDWKAAVAALEKSMELRKGGDSFDWFFLAMAHWRLGEKGKAREWYDRAVQWMDKNQPTNEELRRFRAEAAELLGVKEAKM